MMDVYKDESLTIKKAKSRNKDKFGHRSKYIAILHYKKMPDKIRTMVKATDVPKLIAKHSAVYIAIKEGNYYKLHKKRRTIYRIENTRREGLYSLCKRA